ncbi:MAG: ABC transporter permease [Anaerolineales bacterium]|jgi:simple sugar transport system permease protein
MSIIDFLRASLLQGAVSYSAPLLTAAMGELLLERCGMLDVSLEGKMALGASIGFLVYYFTGQVLLGLAASMIIGAIIGIAFGYIAVYLKGNQIITGMGFLILSTGLASLIYRLTIGIRNVAPEVKTLDNIKLPLLGKIPYLGQVFFTQPALAYFAYLLVPIMIFVLYKTPLGLHIRACGESPRALDTLGVNVFKIRLWVSAVSGGLIALGGAYLPMVLTATYEDGMIAGRGWLVLQLVIFGRYLPTAVLLGSLFFGYLESLKFSLILLVPQLPPQLFLMLPYLCAMIVLVFSQKTYRPESLLKPYYREKKN